MSTLPAVPVLLLLVFLSFWQARRTPGLGLRAQPRLVGLGVAVAAGTALVALAVVWATYLVVDPQLRWTAPANLPAVHGLRGLVIDWLPVPRPYRDGMRIQFGFENDVWTGFLFGRLYHGSLWYYLPAALLVKTPLGMIALWLMGLGVMAAVPRLRPAAPTSYSPGRTAGRGHDRVPGPRRQIRPLRPAVPGGGGGRGRRPAPALGPPRHGGAGRLRRDQFAARVPVLPAVLQRGVRRTSQTRLRLHDSNVDWGQDLGRLADRLSERYPHERVWLVYKGSGVPSYYGIEAADPRKVPPSEVHGLLAVSDTAVAKADGRLAALLHGATPIDDVGHSITIYRRA